MSAGVLVRCPRRRRGSRCSVWAPPTQCRVSTISAVSSSRSATASWMTVRTIRFLSRASVVGADQTPWRSSASVGEATIGARAGRGAAASCSAMRVSIAATRVKRAVPARLQLARHEAVLGIGGVVLPEGPVGRVARRLEVAHHGLARLVAPRARLRLGRPRRLHRGRLHDGRAAPPRPRRRRAGRRTRCSSARRSRAARARRRSAGSGPWPRCTARSACARSDGSAAGPRAAPRRAWARRGSWRGTFSLTIVRIASARSQST